MMMAKQARTAARALAKLTTAEKNECLIAMADALEQNRDDIKKANARDMETSARLGLSAAMLDRLRLDDPRIAAMANGLREVAALPDPVGRILDQRLRPNGLKLQKISTPIGVVVIIYESRPNVTADAAGLCLKSGNATILRGGKEALNSNRVIAEIMVEAAQQEAGNFPPHAVQVVPTTDREAIRELLGLTEYIDLCMPRGGEGLIRAVAECSKVPVGTSGRPAPAAAGYWWRSPWPQGSIASTAIPCSARSRHTRWNSGVKAPNSRNTSARTARLPLTRHHGRCMST